MTNVKTPRVAYIIKTYPRLSETFIVNEILAHEAAGLAIEIYSLRQPKETLCHQMVKEVNATTTSLHPDEIGIKRFWDLMRECAELFPNLWSALDETRYDNAKQTYQAMNLAKFIHQRSITHIHAHFASVAANVARLASKLTGIPYSLTAHAKDIYSNAVNKETLRQTLHNASSVITVSDYNLQYLISEFGIPQARVKRVYNGLSLESFPYSAPEDRPNIVVAVGRLIEKKGFETLIRACQLLRQNGVPFQCFIVGDGDLYKTLLQLITELDLSSNVQLCGPKSQLETKQYIQNAATLVAPSILAADGDRDGLPTVLLESMALGTPCIATDVTGIPEVIIDEETGLLLPQHNTALLANAISRLFAKPAFRVHLSRNARQLIEHEFDNRNTSNTMRSFMLNNTWHTTSPQQCPRQGHAPTKVDQP